MYVMVVVEGCEGMGGRSEVEGLGDGEKGEMCGCVKEYGPGVVGCGCVSGANVCQVQVGVGYVYVSDTSVCRGKVCVGDISSRGHVSLNHATPYSECTSKSHSQILST